MISLFLPIGIFSIVLVFIMARWLNIKTLKYVCLFILILEFIITILSFTFISSICITEYLNLGSLLLSGLQINFIIIFVFDNVSVNFYFILITALILCFSFLSDYFEYDIYGVNIILLSSLFSQLAFIFFCTNDILSLLAFWEWISIVSFFLVQHWSMRVSTIKAGLKVFCISQFGDLPFILSISSICITTETSDILNICCQSYLYTTTYVYIAWFYFNIISYWSVLLISALFLKSAQFFFYPWLLDAMEAPVPISAQLHSSTLVIIGFYVYLRFYDLINHYHFNNTILIFFGVVTVVGASILGFFQDDGKRLLACSTASQLGYVIVGLGLNLFNESILLLAFCCCNKAYIFVWFGVIMEKLNGFSDFKLIGGVRLLFSEFCGITISSLNSTIAPGSFGWHIKGLLTRGTLNNINSINYIAIEILSLTWLFSSLYLLKLMSSLFISQIRGHKYSLVTKKYFNIFYFFNFLISQLLFIIQILVLILLITIFTSWSFYNNQSLIIINNQNYNIFD